MKRPEPWRRPSLLVVQRRGKNLKLRAQPDVVFGNLQRSLQRTLDLAALGLQLGNERLASLPEIGTFPRIQLGSRLDAADLPGEYRAWLAGHAITDMVEALEPLLTDVVKICRVAALVKREGVHEREVSRALAAEDLEVALGPKLGRITQEIPGLIPSDLLGALQSLNKLRVCLTHTGGWVRKSDCNAPRALEVSRAFWEYWVEYESGKTEPVVRGMVTKEAGWLGMRRSRTPRRFRVNDRIVLTPYDLTTIAMTIFEISLILRKNLYEHLRQIGWLARDFKEPDFHSTVRAEVEVAAVDRAFEPVPTDPEQS